MNIIKKRTLMVLFFVFIFSFVCNSMNDSSVQYCKEQKNLSHLDKLKSFSTEILDNYSKKAVDSTALPLRVISFLSSNSNKVIEEEKSISKGVPNEQSLGVEDVWRLNVISRDTATYGSGSILRGFGYER